MKYSFCVVLLCLLLLVGLQVCSCNTVIALKCYDGIVMGSDSFPSVANERTEQRSAFLQTTSSNSFFRLSNNIMLGCAGGLKDFHEVFNLVSRYVREQTVLRGRHFRTSSDSVIKYARKLIYGKFPCVHLIVASIDNELQYSRVDEKLSLTEILPGGTVCPSLNYSVGGTGGDLVAATIDELYRKASNNNKITVSQGAELVQSVLSTTSDLDHYSGGRYISLWILSKKQNNDPSIPLMD